MTRSLVRERSFGSVKLFSPDRAEARRRLGDAARALRNARSDVARVVLFGSLARGDAVPGSDADLLVVIDGSSELAGRHPLDRYEPMKAALPYVGMPVDVFVLTERELAMSPFRAAVARDGIEVA